MLKSEALTVTLGSEVTGVDLSKPLSDAVSDEIYALLLDRGVLVFRDQKLTPALHEALGEVFGPLAPRHPLYAHVPGHERIMVIRNDAKHPPENEEWHADLTCTPDPPFCSLLYGRTIPPVGGDTLWSDMRAAAAELPDGLFAQLENLDAEHSFECGFAYLREGNEADRADSFETLTKRQGAVVQPVIARHPVTGDRLLFVNESFTDHIIGPPAREARAMLDRLLAMVRNPRYQLRVRWRPETVVIWDNWRTQHYAVGDHFPRTRVVERVTVVEDRRSGSFSGTNGRRSAAA